MSPVFFSSVFNGRYYVTCLFFLVSSMEDIMSPVFFFLVSSMEDIMSPVFFSPVSSMEDMSPVLFSQCLPWNLLCLLSFFSSVFHGRYYVTCLFFLSVFHGRYYVTCLFLPVTKKITLHEYRKSYIL